jgi:hypothetical protein
MLFRPFEQLLLNRDGKAFHNDDLHRPLTTSFHGMHTVTGIILQTSPCSARFGWSHFLQYVPASENSIRWVSIISVLWEMTLNCPT